MFTGKMLTSSRHMKSTFLPMRLRQLEAEVTPDDLAEGGWRAHSETGTDVAIAAMSAESDLAQNIRQVAQARQIIIRQIARIDKLAHLLLNECKEPAGFGRRGCLFCARLSLAHAGLYGQLRGRQD
jgi:hypothetical protein